jgi:Na+/melibiose symporter-like transporter
MHHLHLHDFNLWAVLAAALIQWFLGALWYSLFFAKPWMALTGHTPTPGERPKGAVFAMVSSFVGSFILSFILDHFVIWGQSENWGRGAFIGGICWLGFIAVPLISETLYERRPFKLFAINSGYWLVGLILSGAVLAVWR